MTYQELFIDNKDVLIIHKSLANILGDLNEAVVLNQLNYWIERYKETNHNFKDGKYWVYNSYKQWATDNFPFWSETTVKRTFTRLENKGIVVSANYNKMSIDKTKWYSIDYKKLQEFIDNQAKDQNESTKDHNDQSTGQNDFSSGHNEKAIPETTTDITNKDYNTENTDKYALKDKSFKDCDNMYASVSEKQEGEQKPKKKSRYIPKDYTEEQLKEHIRPTIRENFERIEFENGLEHIPDGEKLLEDITVEFFRQYEENMGVKHNILPDKSYINVVRMFVCSTGELREYFDLETYEIMITRYFETDFNRYGKYDGEVTLCLSHFMNDTIRNHLLNREGILWERAEEDYDQKTYS